MTKWLASIKSLDEAKELETCLPDILDLKDPSAGALGALAIDDINAIVRWLDKRCLSSATVGDLVMKSNVISPVIFQWAETDLDYIKVGLFEDIELENCLVQLKATLYTAPKPVIAVIFADQSYPDDIVDLVKQAGFIGVMVDTAEKNGQSLSSHWSAIDIQRFVKSANDKGLICGLAGALRIEDIDSLALTGADYLGFRSALCPDRQRINHLDVSLAIKLEKRLAEFKLAS